MINTSDLNALPELSIMQEYLASPVGFSRELKD